MNETVQQVLYDAARLALAAPSIFNTQPWLWAVGPDRLELRADRTRQLRVVDPDARLLTISCGVALHHATTALAGNAVDTVLLPDPADRDLLAVLHLSGEAASGRTLAQLRRAITTRRTDRRPFSQAPVPAHTLDRLVAACAQQGAHLYQVPYQHLATLALAAVAAGALHLSNPDYRVELADWTHRPLWSGDGVPVETAVEASARRVPVRDFAPFGGDTLPAGSDNDFGALYAIVYTDTDSTGSWLSAGMSLSAILLTATAAGLGTAPISDVTEAGAIREQLRQILPSGYPQVAVRLGHPQTGEPPATPRRPPEEVISLVRA
ncbi:putative NAD(P)H nitroreductase [Rhizocola hellebori]|uniref:Putative NAD(P)H nitroreductase n=1 Tax=Rhizocola hellebori TaxID=1392758 RepID=A0A8J3VIX4_9ACTN|nr:nitroreductase family protein [Rhizocola hellebori]GIH07857.1 putative NAD(P)H nitroreductase [Rhizocola hellebori]